MAWETGTASDHLDLMNKIHSFLTTNAALVAANQQWTSLRVPTQFPFQTVPTNGRIAFQTTGASVNTYADPWPQGVPAALARFSIKGNLVCPTTGTYNFSLLCRSKVQILIDDVLVFERYTAGTNGSTYPATMFSKSLTAGQHVFEVRYVLDTNNPNSEFLAVGWQKPGDGSITTIPAAAYSGLMLNWATLYGEVASTQQAFNTVYADRECALVGPGLSGSDQIYIMLNTISDSVGDYYNIGIAGATTFKNDVIMAYQPGVSPRSQCMYGWLQPMKYWIIASGRRFIVVAKVSTNYEAIYGGFIWPYAFPSEFPYPLAIGGSGNDRNVRFSNTTSKHGSFWRPSSYGAAVANLTLRDTAGVWQNFSNFSDSSASPGCVYPTNNDYSYRPSVDNSYGLTPLSMYTPTGTAINVWGELDGVFHIPGYAQSSENTLVINGVTYIVFQGGHRTAQNDYGAIALT